MIKILNCVLFVCVILSFISCQAFMDAMDRMAGVVPASDSVSASETWPNIHRVAILISDFDVCHSIETQLLGNVPWEIVTRRHIDTILREQNFQLSGYVDHNTAVEAGRLAGVDAVLVGRVSVERVKGEGYELQYQANCDGQLINCQTGALLYSFSGGAPGYDYQDAKRNLGRYIARHFRY